MKDCPSVRLNNPICRSNSSEWILLFGLTSDQGTGLTTSIFANNAVENEHPHFVLPSLDHVPDLSHSPS